MDLNIASGGVKEAWGPDSVQWVVWEDVVDFIPTFHTYLEFQGF